LWRSWRRRAEVMVTGRKGKKEWLLFADEEEEHCGG